MSASETDPPTSITPQTGTEPVLVIRSGVPAGLPYPEYKAYLRYDFFYACAYCTMTEAEAQAIRFTIDHYEPRKARPDLEDDYTNLMYACDECNLRKGDRTPPPAARADGFRFFRPDQDRYHENFKNRGVRLEAKTNTGHFSIEAIDLNRLSLRRLRDLRNRLTACDRYVAEGVAALRRFHIDQLPPHFKAKAARNIRKAAEVGEELATKIDDILRQFASSPLVGPDPEAPAAAAERAARLKKMERLYPGAWRAPRKERAKGSM